MGAWGYGLFQSDADLDVMEEISDEAGKLAKDPDFTFWYPEKEKEVVEKLNSGLYHQLLVLFQQKKWDHGVSAPIPTIPRTAAFFFKASLSFFIPAD